VAVREYVSFKEIVVISNLPQYCLFYYFLGVVCELLCQTSPTLSYMLCVFFTEMTNKSFILLSFSPPKAASGTRRKEVTFIHFIQVEFLYLKFKMIQTQV
jgi:hypothetical protein